MAFGKNGRTDKRSSASSYCSTVTIVAFVALCLVGVWMMTSSSVVPVPSQDENKPEMKQQVSQTYTPQFEDNPGDLPEDAIKGDTNTSGNDSQDDNKKVPENNIEENQEPKFEEKKTESESEEASKTETENGGGEEKKTGDSNTENAEADTKTGGDSEAHNETTGEDKSESEENPDKTKQEDKVDGKIGEKVDENQDKPTANEVFPDGAQSEILNETITQNGAWSTQAAESKNENEVQKSSGSADFGYKWKICNVTAGSDYIPCLDNMQAIRSLKSTKHYEHRERHCPKEAPTCLVTLPEGYRRTIEWPKSREKIWYYNVPHTKLAQVKGHQNWVKVTGEYLTFPGGGTQFKHGALHYIDFIQEAVSDIAWGKRTRVVLDVGCGVASFGGYLFDRDVLTMSFAPKDEHEAQVQFALERGIPGISAVMGTTRLPFPGRVFDAVHCARCRVPWHIEGGKLLLELNRVLRPGGFFVWSATPVYQTLEEDVGIWKAMSALTKQMCWELVAIKNDTINQVGAAIYRKPMSNECYEQRTTSEPPLCKESDDPNAAWNVPLQACIHKVPVDESERGSQWPEQWPARVEKQPYWLKTSQVGVYGKPAPEDFTADYEHWKRVVNKSYLNGMGISWSTVRNVMDMRSVYGGFAAALKDLNVWVMNVVPIDSPDTLPIIYERGLFGIYHDWCESFSTYPRTYDLIHADHIFSKLKKRCNIMGVIAEVDRILRPEGKLIIRDNVETITEIENMAKSMQWEIRLTFSKDKEGLLCVQKSMWRPTENETIVSAI
ncbi:hypothetical protein GIB67_029766 [Kingdonia uniflora]|uniref:Methyltransferase PMT26 n=1 Tax=Kingdonia uniflora TaxID=39325 RepID=A0A7J7NJQ7_9MAGN|nr:hypothetical protein GIB67_029766 [Kingdonia uniflora]